MTIGKGHTASDGGVHHVIRILRGRSAPDAIAAIYQEVRKLLKFRRTDQTMGVYLGVFDVLRGRAVARMVAG